MYCERHGAAATRHDRGRTRRGNHCALRNELNVGQGRMLRSRHEGMLTAIVERPKFKSTVRNDPVRSTCCLRNTELAVGATLMRRGKGSATRPNSARRGCSNIESMMISSASRSSCGIDIHNNTIPAVTYRELGIRYASDRGDAREIFGKVNNLFESGPRTTARRVVPVHIDEFNDGVCPVLGPSRAVGVRPSFT